MSVSKRSRRPGERERFEILLEDVQGKLAVLSEGQAQIRQEMERGFEAVRSEMRQQFAVVEQAIMANSRDIKALQGDVKVLQQDVKVLQQDVKVLQQDVKVLQQDVKVLQGTTANLVERFDVHEQAHAN